LGDMPGARDHGYLQGITRSFHFDVDRAVARQRKHQGMPRVLRIQIAIEQGLSVRRGRAGTVHADPRAVRVIDQQQRLLHSSGGLQSPLAVADDRTRIGIGDEIAFGENARMLFGEGIGVGGKRFDPHDAVCLGTGGAKHRQAPHPRQQPPLAHLAPC
jgi:hypothetical protein